MVAGMQQDLNTIKPVYSTVPSDLKHFTT